MYSRKIRRPPESIIKNGKANFGTFNDVSPIIDIRGMRTPYVGLPLPTMLSKLSIKSRLSFIFNTENYIGYTDFLDLKAFSLVEITFWHRKTGKKYVYHTYTGPRLQLIPKLTKRGISASYKKKRFIKISWGRNHSHHALTFKVKGDKVRPKAEGYLYSSYEDDMHSDFMFISPSPTQSRSFVTWLNTTSLKGNISINGESVDDSQGIGVMILKRMYLKMHSISDRLIGIDKIDGKKMVLHLFSSNLDASDDDNYNNNILIIDGQETLLPPVTITKPFGINNKWIIQDTESMVDLTFTPISVSSRNLDIIILKTTYHNIYGNLDGVLLNKDGEKIILKNFSGILNSNFLRI